MELLPLGPNLRKLALERYGAWEVTIAHYETMTHGYVYAGILEWTFLRTPEGVEYGAYTWGITYSNEEKP